VPVPVVLVVERERSPKAQDVVIEETGHEVVRVILEVALVAVAAGGHTRAGEMGEDPSVARRRRVLLGARVPVVSLAREPPPAYRTVASSTLIRLVCFGGSYG
jgi:hypothetical protein